MFNILYLDAMTNIQNQLRAFEARTGRTTHEEAPAPSNGLASFTVMLIDSVTRLTTYVNEVSYVKYKFMMFKGTPFKSCG